MNPHLKSGMLLKRLSNLLGLTQGKIWKLKKMIREECMGDKYKKNVSGISQCANLCTKIQWKNALLFGLPKDKRTVLELNPLGIRKALWNVQFYYGN